MTILDIQRHIKNDVQDHIKKTNEAIKSYRAKAKVLNSAADQLAKSNSKLKRQLNKAMK